MSKLKEQLEEMMADIKKKAELESRYYQGALDALQLVLSKQVEPELKEEPVKDDNKRQKTLKGPKP